MAHVEKRGPHRYRARYRGPDGRERSKTFDRRIDADRWLTDQEHGKLTGSWVDPALGKMRFAEWVTRWEETTADLRPTTRALNIGVARNYLVPRFGRWSLAAIQPSDVRSMVAEELGGETLSNSAVRRHAIILSTILAGAVAEGRIARNPCSGVKLPAEEARPMRFLEPGEVLDLAEAIGSHYRPLVLTAAYVGLRWGELAGLSVENVDVFRRRIRVKRQLVEVGGSISFGPPKTKAGSRTVTMPATLAEALAVILARPAVLTSGLAFPTPSGKPMRRSNFRRTFRLACERAGFEGGQLDGLVFHELRHTAAALAIAQGAHPVAIKERLGHSSITVTLDTYGGLFPRLDEAITEGLDGVLRDSLAAHSRPDAASVQQIRRSGQ